MAAPEVKTHHRRRCPGAQQPELADRRAGGPVLLQDHHLLEKLAHFNRERIPERVVHAVGIGAGGTFEVTQDVTQYTRAKFLSEIGKKTEVFVRFSTVAGSQGAPDTARDPRGFAVKFYTEDGNYDLVGNNTPVFFIRDPLKFPDFIHTQKPDPRTKVQEPDNVWDFFGLSPELTHQFTWLFGDRGRPASLRRMDGFGSHTFQWMNAAGEGVWVKYHFKTDQGIECLFDDDLLDVTKGNPEYLLSELRDSIDSGSFPSWTLMVQIMPFEDAPNYRFNPFDLTKVWSQKDYPKIEVGRMTLNRWPDNFFAETEQVAFNPAQFVPGIGPSPDKMLQGRLFGYGDTHRYRLGVNHHQIPVNAAARRAGRQLPAGRLGARRRQPRRREELRAELLRRPRPDVTGALHRAADRRRGRHLPVDVACRGYGLRAGRRSVPADRRGRQGAADQGHRASLSKVSRDDIIERAVANFTSADPEYGARVEAEVKKLRATVHKNDPVHESAIIVPDAKA